MKDNQEFRHYTGTFYVSKETIMGELIYNKEEGLILLNLEREFPNDLDEQSFGFLEIITGKLNTGATVTLFENKCIGNHIDIPNYQVIQFASSYMIWAGEEMVDPLFNSLTFTLENALAWSELSLFDEEYFNGLKIVDSSTSRTFHWFDASITFSPSLNRWNQYPRKEETTIIQRLEVKIETETKKCLDFFISVRDKIVSLISFAIK